VTNQVIPLSASGARITITRFFDVPCELVWKEWTDPIRFADWFGGARTEVPITTVSLDVKPGGEWSATSLAYGPDRRDVRWSGEYLEVVKHRRLVFTISGLLDDQPVDVVTVVLSDLGGGRTEMQFEQRGQRTPEQYEVARAQWSAEFDFIADRLADA
jgi:uncharacterized protein YndB with AHSA1/START domain